jgi:hypothetical protein
MQGTSKPKPIESIPTKFTPPPAEAPAADPLVNPVPEPAPVPVLNPEKPIVSDTRSLTVAAREPGKAAQAAAASPQAPAGVTSRMLIIAGLSLMLIAGILGIWMLLHMRSRNRISYISRSMVDKP